LDKAIVESIGRKPVESWGGYDYYLRGMKLYHQGNLNALIEAQQMFRKALDHDPTFGRAYARLAGCYQIIRDIYNQPISEDERTEAVRLAEQAVQLASDDEIALAIVAFVFGMLNGEFERGAELADRAIALNPNVSGAWNARGFMSAVLGDAERALEAFAQAIRLNPMDTASVPQALFGNAAACLLLGRYEESSTWARKMLTLRPNDIRGLFVLTGSASLAGQSTEASNAIARIKRHHPQLRSSQLRLAFRVRRPAHMAIVEHTIRQIGLPE